MAKTIMCEICKAKIETSEGYYSVNKKYFCPVCYQRQGEGYETNSVNKISSMNNISKNLYDEFIAFRNNNTWLEKNLAFIKLQLY